MVRSISSNRLVVVRGSSQVRGAEEEGKEGLRRGIVIIYFFYERVRD